jgi:hypothetical protein
VSSAEVGTKKTLSQADLRYAVGSPYGDSPVKIICPFHDEDTPSFTVFADGAKCFGCGTYLTPEQFVEHFEVDWTSLPAIGTTAPRSRAGGVKNMYDVETQVLFWAWALNDGPRKERRKWFQDRGFGLQSIDRFKFGHDGDNFIVPIWQDQKLVGYKRRRDPLYADPDALRQSKYINMKGMGVVLVRPDSRGKPVVFAEGELDTYLLSQYGVDAITAVAGTGSFAEAFAHGRDWIARKAPYARFYVATDLDEAGPKSAQDIQEIFAPIPVYPLRWPTGNDISEYLCSVDVMERSAALRQLIERAS